MKMKNDFRKNGRMRVRFRTAEEQGKIIRVLEQKGFRTDESMKRRMEILPQDTRTFDISLNSGTFRYGIRPFIGAAMMSGGVRFYSAEEFFRIAELGFEVVPRFPVFHVPHDGREFPEELMDSVCIPEDRFLRYHEIMRDTDMVSAVPVEYRGGDMCCACSVSRLLCDVERFIGPEEVMERYGMGFCYEKACDGTVIKNMSESLKRKTLAYYREHHAGMDRITERHPRILLVDLHSYSDEILPPAFLPKDRAAPDLCIGTEERFTPPELVQIVKKHFVAAGFSAAVNTPYSGCYIPNAVLSGKSACDCIGIMLEIHKRKYCDQAGRSIPQKLEMIAETIRKILADCVPL